MERNILGFLGLIAIVALFVIGFILAIRYESRKRNKKLNEWALKRGLSFSTKATDPVFLLQSLEKFQLFSPGKKHPDRNISNILEGRFGEVDTKIFEYYYDAPSGDVDILATKKHVVYFFKSPELDLPPFSLRPEGLSDKAALFGSQDIDFPEYPKFSKEYMLTGEMVENVQLIFTPDVLSYFENHKGICMEGYGDEIVFYKPIKLDDSLTLSEPDKMEALLEQGLNVVSLFSFR